MWPFKKKTEVKGNQYRVVKVTLPSGKKLFRGEINQDGTGWTPMYAGTTDHLQETIKVINSRKVQDEAWDVMEKTEVVYP